MTGSASGAPGSGDLVARTESVVPDADAMRRLGRTLGAVLAAGDLVVLTGPLGAGKTTLAGGIGDGLGVRGPITSPTFVLARTHPSVVGGPPLVHVDAYRLRSPAELDDLDLDYAASVVLVEWGAGLVDGIADSMLEVEIDRSTAGGDGDDLRRVRMTGAGPRWAGGLVLGPPPAAAPPTLSG